MTAHIKASHGPDVNINKFYVTQYSTTYGKQWENFEPRKTRHYGTGYLANFRPGVYYSRGLDLRDNPAMANIMTRNYNTITKLDYQPWIDSIGRDPLPRAMFQPGSGFIRENPLNIASSKQVNGVHINTRVQPQTMDTLPRHVPLLHKLNCRDPVELENTRYGPFSMSTETKQRFRGLPTDHVDTSVKTPGYLTETGFTHNKNIEPVSFHPDFAHKNDNPAWLTNRPIGKSITKTTFVPLETPDGRDPFGVVSHGSERGSGFTKEPTKPAYLRKPSEAFDNADDIPGLRLEQIRKDDPVGYLNNIHPHNNASVATYHWTGQQRPSKTMTDILERTDVGPHSDTGFTENNDRYVGSADRRGRFITDNMVRFAAPASLIHMAVPYTRGNVQERDENGFCRSTGVHSKKLGDEENPTESLRSLEPYVARSIKSRDRFHDDHTHDDKLSKSLSFASLPERRVDTDGAGTGVGFQSQNLEPYVCRNMKARDPLAGDHVTTGHKPKKTVTFSSETTRAYTHT